MKPLEGMSPAELAALFPIIFVPHRDGWQQQYAQESARLLALLPPEGRVPSFACRQHGH